MNKKLRNFLTVQQYLFKKNMDDQYKDRPTAAFQEDKHLVIDKMCFAEFLRYYLKGNIKLRHSQSEELTEELVECNHPS